MIVDISKLNSLADLAKSAVIADAPTVRRGGGGGGGRRKRLAKPIGYARPSMKAVVDRGAGSGLWTGSQPIDHVLLNQPLRHTRAATRLAAKGGHLNVNDHDDWPDQDLGKWAKTIGKRQIRLLVATAKQNDEENCPESETMAVIEDQKRHMGATEASLEQKLRELRSSYERKRS